MPTRGYQEQLYHILFDRDGAIRTFAVLEAIATAIYLYRGQEMYAVLTGAVAVLLTAKWLHNRRRKSK